MGHHASRDAKRHANERSFASKNFIMHAVVTRPTTLATLARAPRETRTNATARDAMKIRATRVSSTMTTTRSRVTTTKSGRDHILARGFSVESDVVGPIKDTIADVQSVSGIKRVAERACLYGAIGVMAFASIQAIRSFPICRER